MFTVQRSQKYYKKRREDPIDRDFIKLFRFTRESVEWLTEHFLGPESGETRGGAVDKITKMKIFLRYVADPGFQIGVGEDIGVSQPTVSNVVNFVTRKIFEKAHIWIKFPQDYEAMQNEKQKWQAKFHFPTAIGAIDCTLIRIKKIGENRHGNVQATCNSEEHFTSVSAEWPGSVHDSRIWRNSDVCRVLRTFGDVVLLGDQGYGIEMCLMVPFREPRTAEEVAFNNLLKRERVIIERCFGQLKQRFPLLQNTIRLPLCKIPATIVVCCVLHNIGKYLKDEEVLEPEEAMDLDDNIVDEEPNVAPELRREGQITRNRLATVIYMHYNN